MRHLDRDIGGGDAAMDGVAMEMDDGALLTQCIEETLAARPEAVQAWRESRPGAWGLLAGQGVLAYRRRLGRRLTDAERRAVWAALWQELERQR